MEQVLTVSYVAPEGSDYACLSVMENKKGHIRILNMFYGAEAELLYRKLAEPALPVKTNLVNAALMERDHWLMDRLAANFGRYWDNLFHVQEEPAVKPIVISKEKLEEILQEPVRSGPAALLHNKECPYDYKCKAVDCIECAEIYAQKSE